MMKKLKKGDIVLIAVVTALVALGAFLLFRKGTEEPINFENTGTTCGNIVMGAGTFAYRDGFVYVSADGRIIEYDLESGIPAFLELTSSAGRVKNLFISESDIYYTSASSLNTIRRDGKDSSTIFERNGCQKFFVEGTEAYFMDFTEGSLFRKDMQTMKENVLISRVNSYYVDEAMIYVVAKGTDDQWKLFCSNRDEVDFKQIELSFQPIAVYADEQGIFLTERGADWQIVRYADGAETRLPCYGMFYQVLGDRLIYLEKQSDATGTSPLKSYNLTTEEETLLHESVYDFCILEERYIACDLAGENEGYILIDNQTGETIQIYIEGEK